MFIRVQRGAMFSNTIAFIIPRTFKRKSIQNRLDLRFHLVYSEDLPVKPCCFEPIMNAKCCFQIWVKKIEQRQKFLLDFSTTDFTFLNFGPKDDKNQPTVPIDADFAIKAYGSNCGEIRVSNLDLLRPKSWHWIKSNIEVNKLIEKLKKLDYSISKDSTRQDSIGKKELLGLYIIS